MKLKIAIKIITITIITTIFIFLGDKDGVLVKLKNDDYIGANVNVEYLQLILFFIGTFFGVFFISYPYYIAAVKIKNDEIIIFDILKNSKSDFLKAFCSCIRESHANIDIRILVPHQGIINKIKSICNKHLNWPRNIKTIYKIVNIKDLHNDKTKDDLVFELSPVPQGIVGKAYNEKTILLNFDMKNPAIKQTFNLTDYQYSETSDLYFCAAFPILNNKSEVIAIVSFDSKNKLTLNAKKKDLLSEIVRNYAKFLHLQFALLNKK